MSEMSRLVAIVGPTGAGKSALAMELAEMLGVGIACCDSAQVYRGLDIGTAKPTASERAQIPQGTVSLYKSQHWSARTGAGLYGPAETIYD